MRQTLMFKVIHPTVPFIQQMVTERDRTKTLTQSYLQFDQCFNSVVILYYHSSFHILPCLCASYIIFTSDKKVAEYILSS